MAGKWVRLQFSRTQIDKAGKALVENNISPLERIEILNTINNWRSSHSYPLHLAIKNLQKKANKISSHAITARRLKRLTSIILKLKRNPTMKLTQMQDIGGCRAIMPTIFEVNQLIAQYNRASKKFDSASTRTEIIEQYDYISQPKTDGYRSYHLVTRYRSNVPEKQAYDGMRIEIQIRSQLQHAWATAVETISTFTDQALKSGLGDERWKRFFALMASLLALREGCPVVPNTPSEKKELTEEVKKLYRELQVEIVLMGISAVVPMAQERITDAEAYLLVLDTTRLTLEVKSFSEKERANAAAEYLRVEEQYVNDPTVQAVLVSVDSLASLQNAYPNYYLDTHDFLEAVRIAIAD